VNAVVALQGGHAVLEEDAQVAEQGIAAVLDASVERAEVPSCTDATAVGADARRQAGHIQYLDIGIKVVCPRNLWHSVHVRQQALDVILGCEELGVGDQGLVVRDKPKGGLDHAYGAPTQLHVVLLA